MIDIPVYTPDGKKADTLSVDEALLGGEIRPALLKQAYVMYHANKRQGSASNRGRGEKEGSTRKLYKQKGTGNARVGNARTAKRKGGGVAFAKKPRSHRQSMPVKMRRLATRNALLAKVVDGELKLITGFGIDAPKTSKFAAILGALGINRTCLLALDPADVNTQRSARNIADITTTRLDQLNAYDILSTRFLLAEKSAFEQWLNAQSTAGSTSSEEAA